MLTLSLHEKKKAESLIMDATWDSHMNNHGNVEHFRLRRKFKDHCVQPCALSRGLIN